MTNTKSRIGWLLAGMIVICIISPVLTGYGAVGATLAGNRLEVSLTAMNNGGYILREVAYIILGIFGNYFWFVSGKGEMYLVSILSLISLIIIKDIIYYGAIDWTPYGLRPLLTAFSCALVSWSLNYRFPEITLITASHILHSWQS
jgi:hypothetical protein